MKHLKTLSICFIFAAMAACLFGIQTQAADSNIATVKVKGTCYYSKAYEVLDLVNEERAAEGLSSLTMDKELLDLAMQRAAECSIYFSHTRPAGEGLVTDSHSSSVENIAMGQTSASQVVKNWMSSSGHKKNILSSSSKIIGIGCCQVGGCTLWVQIFNSGTLIKVASVPSDGTKTFSINVDVNEFDFSLRATDYSSGLPVGKTDKLEVHVVNPDGDNTSVESNSFKWTSSDTSVATVSSSGKVKGVKKGTATIKAKDSTGNLSMSKKVKVVYNLSTKISSAKNTSKGIKVKWKKAPSATGYYVYRKSQGGEYKKIKTIKKGSTISYTDQSVKDKDGKVYTYKVIAYHGNSKGSGATHKIIRLKGTKLTSVKNTSSKKATVKWKKGKKVTCYSSIKTGYQVQYSTSKDFPKGSKTKSVKTTSASKTSKVISKLKKGKTYYVRIRRYTNYKDDKNYSAWSSVKKVKIKK